MKVKLLLVLLGALLSAVAAESKRETELMEQIEEASGLDDEDSDSYDESSGSGYSDEDEENDEDYLEFTDDTPTTTLGNHIEENGFRNTKNSYEVVQQDNDLKIIRKAGFETQSNEISMASTSHGFFSRTEVVIAVVAGGLVGLVFAIIIVLVVMRVRRNKNLAYDTVKKPIYKKAPTIEA